MGLDMYLEKRHYVRNWDHMPKSARHAITVQMEDGKPSPIKPERISGITEHVAYWRKANAIHAWFVKNVQGGTDDCGEYRVERAQLQALKELCDRVLALPKTKTGDDLLKEAQVLLPTQGGFFFGSTDYDEGYVEDLQRTSKTLGELLAEPGADRADYYYHSSW